jgi:plasmid stabilization system protein ParE
MPKYDVAVSDPARQDVLDIARYISAGLLAPDSAMDIAQALYIGMKSLDTDPQRQPLVRDERLAAKGYRVLPVKNYLIFYIVDKRERVVDIIRILYNRRDWVNLL